MAIKVFDSNTLIVVEAIAEIKVENLIDNKVQRFTHCLACRKVNILTENVTIYQEFCFFRCKKKRKYWMNIRFAFDLAYIQNIV
uniref:Uncharacterized protein n=1 Tax=Pyxicephalus adspersus TaxID=30357 RepID=A0AAV3AQS4_PYXAD|nr:TPA: hypothetical protein GDO54_011021 [Pyxicephalus adspersus]